MEVMAMMAKRTIVWLLSLALALPAYGMALEVEQKESIEDLMPKAGPELEVLKKEEGIWDAVVEAKLSPNSPPLVSRGVETNRIGAGGLWLISDFQSELMGKPYQGHGVYGYDPDKKKYTGVWVDSMQTYLAIWEGTFDAAKKTMTMWTESPDAYGKIIRWRGVTEWKTEDSRIWTGYMPGPDGKEFPTMIIRYQRRK
jgi:hypothetical protein